MFFVLPSAVYPRQTLERLFKALYQLGNIIHAMSFVVLMTEFYIRLESSIPGYFTSTEVFLSKQLAAVMSSCTYTGTIYVGGVGSKVEVTEGSLPLPLLYMAQYILGILVVEFLAILNNGLGMMGYSTGRRHLRVVGVHIPLYHVMATMSIIYCIALIVMVWVLYPMRKFYANAVLFCVKEMSSKNNTLLLASEYDSLHLFDTPVEWAFAAALVNLAFSIGGIVVLAWHSSDSATVLLSASSVPWEKRGVLCTTDKAALRIHTTARETILKEAQEALARGEKVRIVRSYALMTEADYQAQVEEMRRRFAARVKEQQYEQMCTYFERESDLDEEGLLWRRQAVQPPPPPPPPPPSPHRQYQRGPYELYEVPFSYGNHLTRDGDAFDNVFINREHEGEMWNGFDDYTYVIDADEGSELAEFSQLDQTKRQRHHTRRRHRHHGDDSKKSHHGILEEDGYGNAAALVRADELEKQAQHEGDSEEGGRGEAIEEDAVGEDGEDVHHLRRHRRRRRHHHRRTGEHADAGPGAELDGDQEMASPLENADEL